MKLVYLITVALVYLSLTHGQQVNLTTCVPSNQAIYDFEYLNINQTQNVSMSSYRGKVILLVNVATFCGYTEQYPKLNALKDRFGGERFEIIAFPCNQFLLQEPGFNAQHILDGIKYLNPGHGYVPNFPVAWKIDVNGQYEHPIYGFLKAACPATRTSFSKKDYLFYSPMSMHDIRWNFEKILVDVSGKPFKRYDRSVDPDDLADDIQSLLVN